jgi:hypothetical protein
MDIDPLFLPKVLRENGDEVLKYWGLERAGDDIYDPLQPRQTLVLTPRDIVMGSLKIEPYKKRRIPSKINLVACYKRVGESVIEKNMRTSTLTLGAFLRSLPPLYHFIGGFNDPVQIQIIGVDTDIVSQEYILVQGLKIKETTLDVRLILRLIEREVVEEACVVDGH